MKNNKIFYVSIIIYRLLLDYIYVLLISPKFSFRGFTCTFNFEYVCISWSILIISLYFFSQFLKTEYLCSSQAAVFFYLLRFIPFTSMLAFKSFDIHFVVCMLAFWGILFSTLYKFPSLKFNCMGLGYRSNTQTIMTCYTCIIVYKILLDYLYIVHISPYFSYAMLTCDFNWLDTCLSWGICICSLPVVTLFLKNLKLCSSQAAIILYLLRFIPFTSMIAFKDFNMYFVINMLIFWGGLFFVLYKLPNIKIIYIKLENNNILLAILVILCCTILYISGYYAHFRINFDLQNVYELRLEAREFDLPLLFQYLWPAASNVLPIMMVYFLLKKKRWIFIFIGFIILLNFSINGSKSTLFKMLLCLSLIFIRPYNVMKWIILGLPIFCFLTIIVDYMTHSVLFSALVARRVLFIPTLLDSLYYQYISDTTPVFFNAEAATEIAFSLGDMYFQKEEMRCNNGLFTDAFLNLGTLGCVIFPIILGLFFKVCNPILKKVNPAISVFSTLLICTTLGSATFTTSLLTHGLLLLLITCYLMASYNNSH